MRTTMRPSHHLLAILQLCGLVCAVLRNITIDDTFGDPETSRLIDYIPAGAWNDGRNCNACTAHPSEDMIFRRTWTDSTFNKDPGSNNNPNTVLSASIIFNGTAVYVQCALARTKFSPTGNSDMSFLIDGRLAGTFIRDPSGLPGYDYNVTVFSATDLSPREHTLIIQNGHVNGTKSLMLLDAIIYTQDDGQLDSSSATLPADPTSTNPPPSPPTTSSTSDTTVIVAAVVGSITGIILFALAFLLYRSWRRRQPQRIVPANHFLSDHTSTASWRTFDPNSLSPAPSNRISTSRTTVTQLQAFHSPSGHSFGRQTRYTNLPAGSDDVVRHLPLDRYGAEVETTWTHERDLSRPSLVIDTQTTSPFDIAPSLSGGYDTHAPPPAYETQQVSRTSVYRTRDRKGQIRR